MALEKVTVVDQIEISSMGDVGVRLKLLIVEDGATVLSSRYHRTMIPADVPVAAQMDLVNAHLAQMGESPVDPADLERLDAYHQVGKLAKAAGRTELAKALFRKPEPKL